MSEIRVRISQVQNARVALAIYYSKSEIGNGNIKQKSIGCGKSDC